MPAGTFNAFRVEISSADGGADKKTLWIAGETHKLVKATAVLASMGQVSIVDELGCSLNIRAVGPQNENFALSSINVVSVPNTPGPVLVSGAFDVSKAGRGEARPGVTEMRRIGYAKGLSPELSFYPF